MDLSFLKNDSILAAMDNAAIAQPEKPRDYLGMSEIGDICVRRLWLKFHAGLRERFSPRLLRLFNLGHMIEARIIDDLERAGFPVQFKQIEFSDFGGNFRGHCDGVLLGIPESKKSHILEVKSANDKNFELFKKNGIMAHENYGPKYMAQIQCYMGYMDFNRALFIIENKETSERYQERIRFDRGMFESVKARAGAIINSAFPPRGISRRADWHQCRFCFLNNTDMCRKQWPGEPAF